MGPCKSSPEVNIGMICSLSIPIITICALILLIIIVSLLDFIFNGCPGSLHASRYRDLRPRKVDDDYAQQ